MNLGIHITESLLVEMDIMASPGTAGGGIDITAAGGVGDGETHTPTVDSSERVLPTDKKRKKRSNRRSRDMREYTEEEVTVIMEDWKTTAAGGVVGAAAGAGVSAAVWAKKRLKLKKKMTACEKLERGQIGKCKEKVADEIKTLKKKALKYGAAATAGGAAVGAGGTALFQHLNKAPSTNSTVKLTAKAGKSIGGSATVAIPGPPKTPPVPKPQSVKPLLSMSAKAGGAVGNTAVVPTPSAPKPKSDTLKNVATTISSRIPKVSKTTKGAAAGAVLGGGGYYVAKKQAIRAKIDKLETEKKKCQDDDCRNWIDDKIARVREEEKDIKKKAAAAGIAGAGVGAAAANAGSIKDTLVKGIQGVRGDKTIVGQAKYLNKN